MKRHGLWAFHYEARQALEYYRRPDLRWWNDLEIEKIRSLVSARHCGYGRNLMHSNADLVMVCAARYIRRFGLRCVNLRQWIEICARIAKRAGFCHHMTVRKFSLDNGYGNRRNPRITIHLLGEVGSLRHVSVEAKWYPHDVEERAKQLQAARAKAIAAEDAAIRARLFGRSERHVDERYRCSFCGGRITNPRFNPSKYADGIRHCSQHACREMAYLSHTPQSRGGIQPTPRQSKAMSGQLHDMVRVMNYLQLKADQAKRKERDVRNQAS